MRLSSIVHLITFVFTASSVAGFTPSVEGSRRSKPITTSSPSSSSSLSSTVPADFWEQLLAEKELPPKQLGKKESNDAMAVNSDTMLLGANGLFLSVVFFLAALHPTEAVSTLDTAVQVSDKSADLFVF